MTQLDQNIAVYVIATDDEIRTAVSPLLADVDMMLEPSHEHRRLVGLSESARPALYVVSGDDLERDATILRTVGRGQMNAVLVIWRDMDQLEANIDLLADLPSADWLLRPLDERTLRMRLKRSRDHLHALTAAAKLAAENQRLKRSEEQVVEWRNRYEAAIIATNRILYDWNAETNELLWAGNYTALLGYSRDEMGPTLPAFMELIHPADRSTFELEIERILNSRAPAQVVYRIRHKEGHYLLVEDVGRFFFNAAGQPVRMVGFLSDITERRAAEEARERLERRTGVLAELDRMKTAFFSNISHELRTPLTLILGTIEEAIERLRPADPLDLRPMLDSSHRNALRLRKLVNNLLDLSRVEAGKLIPHLRPVAIGELTASLADVFRSAIEHANLALRIDMPRETAEVPVDREMWEKIVFNLMSNAYKHTFTGRIEVTGRLDAETFSLSVKDTGVGIPADQIPVLFERFHQVRNARARSHEGSGIGLALVKELVEAHGGSVRVTSKEGVGSEFVVKIPRHAPVSKVDERPEVETLTPVRNQAEVEQIWLGDAEEKPAAADSGRDEPALDSPDATILLVEDNTELRTYIRRILNRTNPRWSIVEAPNGQKAFELARSSRPDLILSDVMMPVMGGFELVARIRGEPLIATTPIVLISARAGEDARIEGIEQGADDYLIKPFSARELAARVKTQVELSRMRRFAERHEAVERELRRAVQMRDDFLCVCSHELRTPLTVLKMRAQMAAMTLSQNQADDPTGDRRAFAEFVTIALNQLDKLTRMIEDMLDVNALNAGKPLVGEPTETDYAAMVASTFERFRPYLEKVGCSVSTTVEPKLLVRGDVIRLEQVLANLISNIVKYAPGSHIDVDVRRSGDLVLCTIADDGPGIAKEFQEIIFERFGRAVSPRHVSGFGLGLYLSREIMAAHGGSITVHSESGEGAVFELRIPLAPGLEVSHSPSPPLREATA